MPYEAVSFPIGGRDVYRGLIVLYSIIAVWALGTVVVGAQTVGQAAGPIYARIFPVALFFCALAALFGVVRSRYSRRVWVEYAGTALLLAGLVGFSGSIIWGAFTFSEFYRLPGSLLPMMVGVFPTLRMGNILKVVRRTHKGIQPLTVTLPAGPGAGKS